MSDNRLPHWNVDPQGTVVGLPIRAIPEKVYAQAFLPFWRKSPLSKLTGKSFDSPIVTVNAKDGEGLAYNMSKIYPLNEDLAIANTIQKRGKEQRTVADTCPLYYNQYSFPVISENRALKKLASPIGIADYDLQNLTAVAARHLDKCLVREANWGLYPPVADLQQDGNMPATSRVVCGSCATGVSNGGYQYSKAKKLSVVLNEAMPQAAPMTFKTLQAIHSSASIGGMYSGVEFPIRPVNVTPSGKGDIVKYYLFIDTVQKFALRNDPDFIRYTTTRSTTDTVPQPLLGANYITNIEGLYIYELELLNNFRLVAGTGTQANCSWSILLGAGAIGLGWKEYPVILTEPDNMERHLRYASHEIRAHGGLRYRPKSYTAEREYRNRFADSFLGVEQGILHVFNRFDPATVPVQGSFDSAVDEEYNKLFHGQILNRTGAQYLATETDEIAKLTSELNALKAQLQNNGASKKGV